MNDVLIDWRVVDAMEEDLLFFLRVVFIDPVAGTCVMNLLTERCRRTPSIEGLQAL